jgi:hypothetical protein
MYTVLEDTGELSTDFQNDKAQPFGGKEEDENGYLTLGRNARPVCVENTYITLEREDVAVKGLADVHNANEADDEGLYLEVESRNMGMVNKADVETDDEGKSTMLKPLYLWKIMFQFRLYENHYTTPTSTWFSC